MSPNDPIVYVVLNGELNMSPGKAAAQAVHASSMLPSIGKFGKYLVRTVITLEAKNTQQILNLHTYLKKASVPSDYYIDEGVNEVGAYSVTALAVGPMRMSDEEARAILKPFPLFGKKKKWWKR